ncbi:MAG: Gldg family protein [Clostridia bacterium]|nr:Gldg family protein [Clostridia bacterium]
MKNGFLRSFASSKKLKYSTISIAFTAIVVAIIILFNSIFTALSENYGWYIDMTEEQIFTLSDDAKELIATVSKDTQIEIIFTSNKDLIENQTTTHAASIGFIVSTAEELAKEFDNITVSYHDSVRDKAFFDELRAMVGEVGGAKITEESIIVARKDAGGRYAEIRSYGVNNFFAVDENNEIHGYSGEITFASAIMGLTAKEKPTVYFTVGHNELSFLNYNENTEVNYSNVDSTATTGANPKAKELMRLFTNAGYTVKPIDISKEPLPSQSKETPSIIVINAPTKDFSAYEIDYLTQYLMDDEPGTVFCFLSGESDMTQMTRLSSFIETSTGSSVQTDSNFIQDDDFTGNDIFGVAGLVPTNNATTVYLPGYSDQTSSKVGATKSGIIVPLVDKYWDEDGYYYGSHRSFTMPLVTTSKNATFKGEDGVYNIMTMTATNSYNQETATDVTSYFLLSMSSEMVTTEFLQDNYYINDDLIYSLIRTTGGSQMGAPEGIEYKMFIDYDLEISAKDARLSTICLAVIIPVVLIGVGVVIIVKRKRR